MKHKIIFFSSILFFLTSSCALSEPVAWNGVEGIQRLERSKHKADFFQLANHFESQINAVFCGPASSVVVLNALRLNTTHHNPLAKTFLDNSERVHFSKRFNPLFERYTQNNIFLPGQKTKMQVLGQPMLIKGEQKKDFGFQVRQLYQLLKAHGLKVQLRVVSDKLASSQIKLELINNMKTSNDYVLINYHRKKVGQTGSGHISPLGAYDKKTDSFLIIDVNPNRHPWAWISADVLISAMRTFDTIENRGYLLVRD